MIKPLNLQYQQKDPTRLLGPTKLAIDLMLLALSVSPVVWLTELSPPASVFAATSVIGPGRCYRNRPGAI